MIIFNDTSADFVLISVENDHNFEQNENLATVILKWTDFSKTLLSLVRFLMHQTLEKITVDFDYLKFDFKIVHNS